MLTVDFHGVQSCDCCNYSIVDDTNYGDNSQSLFSDRQVILTYADGTQNTIEFPFESGLTLAVPQTKDFAATATLKLTAISPIDGTVYFKDRNIVSTCNSDQFARNKQKELLLVCDHQKVLYQLMDIQSGINSAIRLNRLGLIDETQAILTYLDRTYRLNTPCPTC